MAAWPEIPGVTSEGGRPMLPRRPATVAALLRELCRPGATLSGAVELAERRSGEERTRVEGLAGWLPLSHVVQVEPTLRLHPETSPFDLGVRYAAWAGSRVVAAEHAEPLQAYARAVVEAVAEARLAVGPRAEAPWSADAAAVSAVAVAPRPPLAERLARILIALERGFLEREGVLRAALLALLAGRHVLLLGPPGTAKSMLARALCEVLVGGRYFEYLLSRFTHPDELFGPVSIPGLKEEDYRRLTDGFLPAAHVAFLDEVFKANSAILNSLLTLVNERTFHHGRHHDPVPLVALVGASNELPDPEGGLAALYDRFLVRLDVPPVADPASFLAVCTGALASVQLPDADRLTLHDLDEVQAAAAAVDVPPAVGTALVRAWQVAAEKEWGVSDRRWRHAVEMLRVAAAAEGRGQIDLMDLLLLEPVLAPDPARRAEVREVLVELVAPRAVPRHDLRAQWALLHLDRVAPIGDDGLDAERPGDHVARLAQRRRHAARVVAHAERAVARLAEDRERLERRRGGRLWVDQLPSRILAAHLEAGRDLARVLEAAERYRDALTDEAALPGVLLAGLPTPARREFGAGVALRLRLEEPAVEVGLSLAGERVPAPEDGPAGGSEAPHLSRTGRRRLDFDLEVFQRAPELVLQGAELVQLVRGELAVEQLLPRIPVWAARNASQALARMIERLGATGIPRPPELPELAERAEGGGG